MAGKISIHYRRGDDPRSGVSKTQLDNLVEAMRQLGDIQGPLDFNRLIAPGVTQVND